MTGRHKRRTGVGDNSSPGLNLDEVTIAAYLRTGCQLNRDPCYTTGLIGKWHLGFGGETDPWDKGFVEAISHSQQHRDYFGKSFFCGGSTPGCSDFGTYDLPPEKEREKRLSAWWCNDNNGSAIATNSDKCRFSARVYRDLAIDFIERHRLDAAPFLLVLAVNTVHTTHKAPERTKQHYQATAPQAPAIPKHQPGRSDTYWALIEELDASVGKILEKLDHPATVDSLGTPLKSNTLVLFTSDHGAPENPYGIPMLRGGKGGSYDGGTRVPFLARACNHPAQVLSPSLEARTFSHTDIFPTIAEAARQPVDPINNKIPAAGGLHYIEGRTFYQLLLPTAAGGTPDIKRNYTYFEWGPAAIVSRESTDTFHAAQKVCSYEGVTPEGMPVRGASCTSCTGNCTGVPCTLLGKVCCPPGQVSGKVCQALAQETRRRCVSNFHCANGDQCVETGIGTVTCNQCKAVRWKLRTDKLTNAQLCTTQDPKNLEFFDLTSNPEEDERINCRKQPTTATWLSRYCDLFAKLKSWNNCTGTWDGESSCEVQ
jgi:arylsulfatase A-like enzyme